MRRVVLLAVVVACGYGSSTPRTVVAPPKVKLAVLPAESDAFPNAAKAATESLVQAKVRGIDLTQVSKVSLEVVQLSIECVDETVDCYQAAGRSLAADRLLFAQIAAAPQKHLKVTVTLFDVGTKRAVGTAEQEFASDAEATTGVAGLVTRATTP
jgi:hypothetical protein